MKKPSPDEKNQNFDPLNEQELCDRFFDKLEVKHRASFLDPMGDPTVIDERLFWDSEKSCINITKNDLHLYLNDVVEAIKDPHEIFLEQEERPSGESQTVKRMFRYMRTEQGTLCAIRVVFEYAPEETYGVSVDFLEGEAVEETRTGKLVYQKGHLD